MNRTDLKIYPAVGGNMDYALDLLQPDTDTEMLSIISELAGEVGVYEPKGFVGYSIDDGYDVIVRDNMLEEIQYVLSQHLKEALKLFISGSWRNNSIRDYILNMPDNIKIYLYWM